MSKLHVKSFLNSIDFISKFFLLAPNSGVVKKNPLTWRSVTISNGCVLVGFVCYFCVHMSYVTSSDQGGSRAKLVTFFIDNYNKYSGVLMVTVLVLIGYFQQSKTAEIYGLFYDIETIFERNLRIKIQNVNTLR